MIHRKHHEKFGFSLIEVIIALAMVSIIVITALTVQSRIVRATSKNKNIITRLAAIKGVFTTADKQEFIKKPQTYNMTLDVPATEIKYRATPLPKTSALAKIPHLFIENVTATWDEGTTTMTRFIFAPERPV